MGGSISEKDRVSGFLIFVNSFRWLTWLLATVLVILKVTPRFPPFWTFVLFSSVFVYNMIYTIFPQKIERYLRRWPPLILVDVLFCIILLGVYGWRSPFTIYSFSPILLGGYLWNVTGGFIVALLVGTGYLIVEPVAGYSWAELKRLDYLDSHIAHFFDYFLIAVFFSYPTYLMKRLDKTNKGLEETQAKLEKSNSRLETLQEINAAIQASLELGDILKKIVFSLVRQLDFDRASIGLLDKHNKIKWLLSIPEKEFCANLDEAENSPFLKQLLLENKPIGKHDIKDSDTLIDILGTTSLVAFPLINNDQEFIGVLLVDNHKSGEKIDVEDFELLRAFSYQAALAISNAKRFSQSQETGIARERTRIASEMHDNVIQSLYSMRLILDTCLKDSGASPETLKKLELVRQASAGALDELRSTIDDLYEGQLGGLRLTQLAKEQAKKIQDASDIVVNVSIKGREPELPALIKKNIYFILQETIGNVVKHAQATVVRVFIDFSADEFKVQIEDNGIGFSPEEIEDQGKTGLGLKTINSRVERLGGKIIFERAADHGTMVSISIPYAFDTGKDALYLVGDLNEQPENV